MTDIVMNVIMNFQNFKWSKNMILISCCFGNHLVNKRKEADAISWLFSLIGCYKSWHLNTNCLPHREQLWQIYLTTGSPGKSLGLEFIINLIDSFDNIASCVNTY